jgi:hypothetical protein
VVAETYKARGAPVRIAVAPGDYRVLVRRGTTLSRCEVSTTNGATTVDLDRCTSETIVAAATKGAAEPRRMRFELSGLAGGERSDAFTDTLAAFGYQHSKNTSGGLELTALWQIDRRLWVGGFAAAVGSPEWSVPTERQPLRFSWTTGAIGALVRAVQPFGDTGFAARSGVYAQLGAGLGLAMTRLIDQDDVRSAHYFAGWASTLGAGLQLELRHVGFTLGYQFDSAPVIDNLAGDTHASGGHRLTTGVSYAY